MPLDTTVSRRSFLALAGALPFALKASSAAGGKVPVGLELYSVRDELAKDLTGTVRTVAKMGYEVVEFYSPYFSWTPEKAKEVRKLLDDLGVRCRSTHNDSTTLMPENLPKAIELNQIIGSEYVIMASSGRVTGLDGWKAIGDRLNAAAEKLKSADMSTGYHNHQTEWMPVEGQASDGYPRIDDVARRRASSSMSAPASRQGPIPSHGSGRILAASRACTARTGHHPREPDMASFSGRERRRGRRSSRPRSRSVASSTT